MIKIRFKKIVLPTFITLLILGSCVFYFSNKISFKTYETRSSWAYDIKDPKVLYEHSDVVFIGKVDKKIGQTTYSNFPETQFSVEVNRIIKGNPDKTIVINQEGGIKDYSLMIYEGDYLLEEGRTYFFAAKEDKEKNIYNIAPIYGDVLINNDSEVEEYVKRFEEFKN
jgi:hypothetical protein